MKVSDFWCLMDDEFGEQYAHVLVKTLSLPGFDGMSVQEALDKGGDVRALWLGICVLQDVPEERRLGKEPRPSKNAE